MPELIPAIDLRQGRVVRLEKGDDARRKAYDRDPKELLTRFAEVGVRRVHIVDLDAAFGETPQRALLEELARFTPVALEVGGGFRTDTDVSWGLDAGLDRIVMGSVVAKDTDGFLAMVRSFPGRLVPAIETAGGEVKIGGWTEKAALGLEDLCSRLQGADCPAVLVTDVEKDGMLQGPNLGLAERVARATGIPAILSGGVRDLEDLRRAAESPHLSAVIVGKAYYEGHLDLWEAIEILPGGLK
ncbi:MAG: HisA/HisF-related TIM barrel protein [Thermoanaerobaculia bacterium]|nr:HisA/HisF-related TIM barrel protein [Thermoanaerobaculia bacterium]